MILYCLFYGCLVLRNMLAFWEKQKKNKGNKHEFNSAGQSRAPTPYKRCKTHVLFMALWFRLVFDVCYGFVYGLYEFTLSFCFLGKHTKQNEQITK